MDHAQVIIRPVVSEKSYEQIVQNRYTLASSLDEATRALAAKRCPPCWKICTSAVC